MKRTILASIFFIITFVTGSAFAIDGKIYPGSMGIRWNSSDPVPHLSASAVFNSSSTKSLRLDLPVIHDSIHHSISSGWVRVIDRHYNQNIRVSMNSVYRNGCSFWGWWGANKYSAGTNCSAQALSFPGLGSNSQAHYYYSVTIPPTYSGNKSGIVSYYVAEKD